MKTKLHLEIQSQPDDTTCGPTCLHAIYMYYGDHMALPALVEEVRRLKGGGTLAVFLACHALARGYDATIFTYNLHMFDPTWFSGPQVDIVEKLHLQAQFKKSRKQRTATQGYIDFLKLGGKLRFEDLTTALIRKYLKRGLPILTGLSSTYLYKSVREYGPDGVDNDILGEPAGHFVVLCGYDKETRHVLVADPYKHNPVAPQSQYYEVDIDRVISAILLGVLTHDANFLLIKPKKKTAGE